MIIKDNSSSNFSGSGLGIPPTVFPRGSVKAEKLYSFGIPIPARLMPTSTQRTQAFGAARM